MIPWWWLPITAFITWGFSVRIVIKGLRELANGARNNSVLAGIEQRSLEKLAKAVNEELERRAAAT